METAIGPKWPFRCWAPWIIVIVLVIVIIWCFWPKAPQDTFKADLVILDETTAAWAVTNNTFAGGLPNPEQGKSYWTGVLYQFGYAEGAERKFSKVQFYSGGALKGELGRDEAVWIDIVADVPGKDEPMLVGDFPRIDGGCDEIDGCQHCRRLHAHLEPMMVMTYWQGPGGFDLRASQSTGSFNASNEQRFDFKDRFRVTAYRHGSNGSLEAVPGFTFGVGQIDEIRVTFEPTGPGSGVKQDPPWPGP